MRKTLFAIAAMVCSLCVPKLQAQDASSAPRPSITVTPTSITVAAPYFSTPSEVFRGDDGWVQSALQRVACADSASLAQVVNGTMSYATFRARLNRLPQQVCPFKVNSVTASIEVLHSLPPNEDRSRWHTASATQFRVQHAPLERGGNDANPDILARQASQPSYQQKVRALPIAPEDATELINQIIAKQGVPMELQNGDPILINFGTNGVFGERIIYTEKPGEKPFRVLMFRTQSGLVLYIAESCSNPLFPLQAATYSVDVPQLAAKIGIEKFVRNTYGSDRAWHKYISFDGRLPQSLEYMIIVHSIGEGPATDVKLTDRPPEHIRLDPNSPLAGAGKAIGDLAAGASDTTVASASYMPSSGADSAGLLKNTALVETSNAGSAQDHADVEPMFRKAAPPGPPPICFRGTKSTLSCLAVACVTAIVATAIVDDEHRLHPLCGFGNWAPPEGCVEQGNKPCGAPITRFDIVPIGNMAHFNIGWSSTPVPESVRRQQMKQARVGISILTNKIFPSLRK